MQRIRWIVLGVVLVAALGSGIWGGYLLRKLIGARTPPSKILNTTAVLQQIQTLNQLVTVKFVLEKVVVLEDVKWYGENRVLLVAHGIVKAGVDLAQLKAQDLQISDTKIVLALPPAAITDVYLDDSKTHVIERNTGAMRLFDKDLEQNARRQAVDDIRRAARQHEIVPEAENRAKAHLRALFQALGFTEVEFKKR